MNHGLKKQEPFSDQGLMLVIRTNLLPDEVFLNLSAKFAGKKLNFHTAKWHVKKLS
jgi:hypothetical protein